MAWRIHEHILRGEIDNRTRGRVTGRIWLAGLAEPLVLDLAGNCQPDLAGCVLTFENPAPLPLSTRPPAAQQRGTTGEISAARKVRVYDIPLEDAYMMCKRGEVPPEHMANALSIEWYSDVSGRVLIESTDFRLQVSEPAWRFTAEELAERQRRVREEDGDAFIAEVRDDDDDDDDDGGPAEEGEEWDEFRCEQMLRESDMLSEKYGRLMEKYADHPDQERLIAHEMGWRRLEEALDARTKHDETEKDKGGDEAAPPGDDTEAEAVFEGDFEEEPPNPMREGLDWVRDEHGYILHPVAKHARDAVYALVDELKAGGDDVTQTDDALGEFVGHFMTLHVKLAAALGAIARGGHIVDTGLTIAWLKRTLEIHNQTLTAAAAVDGHPRFAAARLNYYRTELFNIREELLTLIGQLRGAGR